MGATIEGIDLDIREQDPLKQGLKLQQFSKKEAKKDSRARSTKTRIETFSQRCFPRRGT